MQRKVFHQNYLNSLREIDNKQMDCPLAKLINECSQPVVFESLTLINENVDFKNELEIQK